MDRESPGDVKKLTKVMSVTEVMGGSGHFSNSEKGVEHEDIHI